MSGLLFLIEVAAIVVLIYWARRNDAIALGEPGTGLFAMVVDSASKLAARAREPRWRQQAGRKPRVGPCASPPSGSRPRWKTEFPSWGQGPR
jgi:hypothetical protein